MTKVYLFFVLTLISSCLSLAIRSWGENCTHSDECYDQRMVCVPDEENLLKCLCDRFHKWNGSSVGCVQVYSISYIMNQTVVVHNHAERMERMQETVFLGPFYSVYFMIFIIATCTLSVFVYCIYIRIKDHQLKDVVAHLVAQNERKRRPPLQRQHSISSLC